MISLSGIRKSYGLRTLLDGVDLRIGARERLALVGPNGSGKTTLLEFIAGRQDPDDGRIEIAGDVTIGYLAQETDALRGRTVLDEVVSAGAAMQDAGHRLQILEREIAEDPTDASLREYARLLERFEALGGYSLESQAQQILAGLGFRTEDAERMTDELSGGWLMRVALAKLLVAAPDALLLDEPTNHLDLESVVWLERFLQSYQGAVVVVAHDRDFLNGVATRVVEIERANLYAYTGNYESFVEQRELRARQAEAAAKHLQRQRAHQRDFIERFRYKASKARQVQSRIKMLERMPDAPVAPEKRKNMRVRFPDVPRAGRIVASLDHVTFGYGERLVYAGLSLELERGEKVALVGPNGAGKTTLLKLFAGALQPNDGERRLGANVACGYFAQHQIEALDPRNRVIEELQRAAPAGVDVRPRDLLGRFLFSGDDIDKPVSVLSGGERSRLALAKLFVQPFNFLCMDEPTNHLDVQSRDVLEDALEEYGGTLVLITHDRHLIRSVANRIVEVIDGVVRVFPVDYEGYLEQKDAAASPPAPVATPVTRDERRERRRTTARARDETSRLRNQVRRVERELDTLHESMKEIGERLADPAFYSAGDGVADAVRQYERAQARAKQLEAEWDRLTAQL